MDPAPLYRPIPTAPTGTLKSLLTDPLPCAVACCFPATRKAHQRKAQAECVEILLAAHADVEAKALHGATPLCTASAAGSAASVELLLAADACIDHTTELGFGVCDKGPVTLACDHGHVAVLKLLVAASSTANPTLALVRAHS